MRNYARRLRTIEKRLIPGREVQICPPVIVDHCGRQPTTEEMEELGPIEGWVAYQRQLQTQEAANVAYTKDRPGCLGHFIEIQLDVDAECEARHCHD